MRVVLVSDALFVIPNLLIKDTKKRFLGKNDVLIEAKYKDDKISAVHAQNIAGIPEYCHDLSKDQSNGFTKDRNMRRIGSFPNMTLLEYDRMNPGWWNRVSQTKDMQDRQKAWREFLASD